jgi:hypothetical protein
MGAAPCITFARVSGKKDHAGKEFFIALVVLLLLCASLHLAAQKLGRISGRVDREDTGGPLSKALVALYSQDEQTTGGPRRTETAADGAFVFADVAPGSYALEVSRNGFVTDAGPGMLNVSVKAGGAIEDLRLKLIPAGAISGTVVDRDGEPVQGLSVRIQGVRYLPGAKRQIFEGMRATTDDRGRFRLYGLNRGLYYLRTGGRIETSREMLPLKQGPDRGLQYGDTWYPENALTEFGEPLRIDSGSEIGDVRVVVKREQVWTITGHVLGGSTELECRKALPVTLMYGSSEEIGPDGAFKIEGVEAGDYVLSARTVRDGKMIFQGYAPVRVIDRNVRTTIPLGGTGEVRGKVTAEGLQPGGMEVYLESDDELAIYPSKVDPAGCVRDPRRAAGRVPIRAAEQPVLHPRRRVARSRWSSRPARVLADCALKAGRRYG